MAQQGDIVYGYHDYDDDIWMKEHHVPSDQMGNLQHTLFDNDFEYWENDDLYW